jgi:allophanate hydrolase
VSRPTAVARVRVALDRLVEVDRPEVWISLRPAEEVLAEAADLDARTDAGERLPLAGLVAAVKDNIDVRGLATTAGAPSYSYEPESDATAVERLRAAGAVVLGKANLDQFATGLVGTRSPYGAVRNAWDPTRISGGSSSGSAVAVALGIVDLALGTDTAGSGRVPAALNGIVGVKPTKGLIPTTGVVPACRTLDCVTVFARDLSLARQTVQLLSGPDGVDPLARAVGAGRALPAVPRIAVPDPAGLEGVAPAWRKAFDGVVGDLRVSGVEVVQVDIEPPLDAADRLYGGAFVAERTAAVGDHIYAHRELVGSDLDPTVAHIVLSGAKGPAVDYFHDRERLDRLGLIGLSFLEDCCALLTPTTTFHPTLAEVADDPVGANSRMGRFTNFANLLDCSALAVPAGAVDGLPFGVMLTGAAHDDRLLAEVAGLVVPSVELLVVGAHLSGEPLNHQLVSAGGSLVAPARTAASYRLHALATSPPKPGLERVAEHGASLAGEVWRLPSAGFARFVSELPAPMTIGQVTLDDGRTICGFLCEPVALTGAVDITSYGGWRAYRAESTG